MSIKETSAGARVDLGGYLSQYTPPTAETPTNEVPNSGVYSRDLNVEPTVGGRLYSEHAQQVYDRDMNVPADYGMDDAYVYNFGPPGSPHNRWGEVAQRSASYATTGVRWSGDVISSKRGDEVNHEIDDLPTVVPLPGYH
jgi:hypothetical protein